MEIIIEGVNFRGYGLGRDEGGRRWRVIRGLEGERVEVEVLSEEKGFGRVKDVICGHLERRVLDFRQCGDCLGCSFDVCGGCYERNHKIKHYSRLIERLSGCEVGACYFHEAISDSGYRSRCSLRWDGCFLGIMDMRGVRMVRMAECPCHSRGLNDVIGGVEGLLASEDIAVMEGFNVGIEEGLDGYRVCLSYGCKDARVVRCLGEKISDMGHCVVFRELAERGSHVYRALEVIGGDGRLVYDESGGRRLVSYSGSWTPASRVNERILRDLLGILLGERVKERGRYSCIMEVGCGCGTHSGILMEYGEGYIGVDCNRAAILSAQENWEGYSFYLGDAERVLKKLFLRGIKVEAAVVHSGRLPYRDEVFRWCKLMGVRDLWLVCPSGYSAGRSIRICHSLGYEVFRLDFCNYLPKSYHLLSVIGMRLS